MKLVIFDLDGVLVNTREVHYEALNESLKKNGIKYKISKKEQIETYDGLSTNQKLSILNKKKIINKSLNKKIWKQKQIETTKFLKKIKQKKSLHIIFKYLKSKKSKIAIATNAIRETLDICCSKLKIDKYIDYKISNDDVSHAKPFPEIYWKCMTKFKVLPTDTLIIEDSTHGREAATNSGATLIPVRNCEDLNLTKIKKHYEFDKNSNHSHNVKWVDDTMNVLIPMAGLGSRFKDAGFSFPKPLIEVNGKPMIQMVVDNLNLKANFIYLVLSEHLKQYNLKQMLNLITPKCKIIEVKGLTEGAACTTLLAKKFINNNNPLLIANSDQIIEWNSNEYFFGINSEKLDGSILTFNATHPKWSFVKKNNMGNVIEVAEKKPISNEATVGIYYWKKGKDYVKYAEQMINKNIRTNNEFYVCPVFNEAILDKKIIKTKKIDKMWGIGTPEDLNNYLRFNKKK